MRLGEGLADFGYLSGGFVGAKVDGGAYRYRAQVLRFLDRAKQHLVKLIRQRQQLVMIDFHDERNLVRILTSDDAQHAKGRGNSVAATFHCQLHNIFRIEVLRIGSKGSAGGMLDTLIYGQDRKISGACEATMVEERLQGTQHGWRTIRISPR